MLEYRLENGAKIIVRPSGTEPKIKVYLSGKGATPQDVYKRQMSASVTSTAIKETSG